MDTVTINMDNLSENDRKLVMELKAKADRPRAWKPKIGETYYFINIDGKIVSDVMRGTYKDYYRYTTGNRYQTKEAAKFAREKAIVQGELQQYAEKRNEGAIDWNDGGQTKWALRYDHDEKRVFIDGWDTLQNQNTTYFTSEEVTEAAIAAIGEDRIKKYIFEVE